MNDNKVLDSLKVCAAERDAQSEYIGKMQDKAAAIGDAFDVLGDHFHGAYIQAGEMEPVEAALDLFLSMVGDVVEHEKCAAERDALRAELERLKAKLAELNDCAYDAEIRAVQATTRGDTYRRRARALARLVSNYRDSMRFSLGLAAAMLEECDRRTADAEAELERVRGALRAVRDLLDGKKYVVSRADGKPIDMIEGFGEVIPVFQQADAALGQPDAGPGGGQTGEAK